MFVLNIKMDYKKILLFCILCAIIFSCIIEFGIKDKSIQTNSSADNINYNISDENFLSTLSKLHENIDENIGKSIKVSGFVYTLPDFNKDFFICGRYTVNDNETKVAGYMCNYTSELELVENEWIEIEGTIIKGNYNGDIPVIKVDKITKIIAPANTYVEK